MEICPAIVVKQPVDDSRPAEGVSERVTGQFFIVEQSSKHMDKIGDLLRGNRVHPEVDSIWKLEHFQEAFDRANSGGARGEVIITM